MSDQQITDLINNKSIPVVGVLPMTKLLKWVARYDVLNRLKTYSGSDSTVSATCRAGVLLVETSYGQGLDLSDPENVGMLNVLVGSGVLQQNEVDDVTNMATTYQSRAQQLGLGTVAVGEVMAARSK